MHIQKIKKIYMLVNFKKTLTTKELNVCSLVEILHNIKKCVYQTQIINLRKLQSEDEQKKAKEKLPSFFLSGTFKDSVKNDNFEVESYTKLIQVDIDYKDNSNVDMQVLRTRIVDLPFVYACFTSPRGNGLKVIVKHNLEFVNHLDAFKEFEMYFKVAYNVIIDTQCKNIARAFFVSADADLYLNENCYPYKINLDLIKEAQAPAKTYNIQSKNVYDFCVQCVKKTCFFEQGSKSKFRLLLAKYLSIYNISNSDIEAYIIANYSSGTGLQKTMYDIKSGLKYAQNEQKKEWKEYEPKQKTKKVERNEQVGADRENTVFEKIINYLTQKHQIRFNEISKNIEVDGKEFSEKELKGLFVDIKLAIPKATEKDFFTYILSNKIEVYNPILEFFEKNTKFNQGTIRNVFDCIELENNTEKEMLFTFFQKWCTGIVAQILEEEGKNMLMPVFTGKGFNYKSTFFEKLLPKEFCKFFCSNQLADGNDSKALMCENILILIDDLAPATTKEGAKLRSFISNNEYTYRQPYALKNSTNKRLASVCGTSNYKDVITEAENNRRIIPFKIKNIDIERYSNINKVEFIIECYNLYKNANDRFAWELKKEEAIKLKEFSQNYESEDSELSLLLSYFVPAKQTEEGANFFTTTQIYDFIRGVDDKTELKIKILGSLLQKPNSGFERVAVRQDGQVRYGYCVKFVIR